MRESYIEKVLVKEVKKYGGWALKLPAVFVSGLPDRMCLMPGGRVFFVELKAPGKKPDGLQPYIHKKLRKLGFIVYVIDNPGKAKELIKEWNY